MPPKFARAESVPVGMGISAPKDVTDDLRTILKGVQGDIEDKAGDAFDVFNPLQYCSQKEGGTVFFIKIDVGGECIHVRLFQDLTKTKNVAQGVQTGKTKADPIRPFS